MADGLMPLGRRTLTIMSLRAPLAAYLLVLALPTGCSRGHGDPDNPKQNPHAVKRYEVTATADAPGPWDSVKGMLTFIVPNMDCVPKDFYKRGWYVPNIDRDMDLTRVNEHTWKGYFYRDSMQGENYFGLGECHWDAARITANFTVHSETFFVRVGGNLDGYMGYTPEINYFEKSMYWDRARSGDTVLGFADSNELIAKHPDLYFPITVTVKEATP